MPFNPIHKTMLNSTPIVFLLGYYSLRNNFKKKLGFHCTDVRAFLLHISGIALKPIHLKVKKIAEV